MRDLLVFFALFFVVCCATPERISEPLPERPEAVKPVPAVNPWYCSVEIISAFKVPEDGKISKPSTLLMRVEDKLVFASGSGTIIKREGDVLTILTAKHVIEGADKFLVKYGKSIEMGFDAVLHPKSDIATFKIRSARVAEVCEVAPVAEFVPAVGSKLDCLGNALGRGMRWMTPGVVAKTLPESVAGEFLWMGSYHSYPGCSGGGVWHDGKVVGVVSRVLVFRVPVQGGVYNDVKPDMSLFVGAEMIHPFVQK